jgi:uncharacterized membrane protein YbhN (UPF0104 family)
LWALLAHVDLSRAKELVDHVSLPLLAVGAAALLASSPFRALHWHIVLAAETTSPGPWTSLKIVLVGLFFNQVLPPGVGGDAVRAWRCHKLGIGPGAAIRSLILDRVSGYFVLVVLFAAGLPVLLHILPNARQRCGIVLLLGAALCGLLALFLMDYLPRRLLHFRLMAGFAALSRAGRRLFGRPTRSGAILSLGAATVGLTIIAFMLVAGSLGVDLPFGAYTSRPITRQRARPRSGFRTRRGRRQSRVRARRRVARRFTMADRLGRHTAGLCEERTCSCPGRSVT